MVACGWGDRASAIDLRSQGMHYLGELSCDALVTVYRDTDGIGVTGQGSSPVDKLVTVGRYRLKVNGGATGKGRICWVRGLHGLIYLDNTTSIWADIHGQPEATAWSASLGWLCGE